MKKLIDRLHDVLLSVYIFNEHRGYIHLDQLAEAFAKRYPNDTKILAAVRKHARDERRHYEMFRQWFDDKGRMPLEVSHRYGYCDLIVQALMGEPLSELDPSEVIADDQKFYRLCRLIMVTEMRGMEQVDVALGSSLLRRDPALVTIFEIIKKDEPSHCYPYQTWLKLHDQHLPSRMERLADSWVHYSLTLVKLPLLFLSFWLPRRDDYPCGAAQGVTGEAAGFPQESTQADQEA
ncbi:MAG: hypothetical protein ACI97A_002900 [Planctomycetota bacterium]|jgi:hypothetical protein